VRFDAKFQAGFRHMVKPFQSLVVALVLTGTAAAQSPVPTATDTAAQQEKSQVPAWVAQLSEKSESYFVLGARAFEESRPDTAREYFNLAVDVLLESDGGVRSHPALYAYYLQLIERIRQYDAQMQQTELGWGQQGFSPSPLDLFAKVELEAMNAPPDESLEIVGDLDFTAVSATPEVRSFMTYFTRGSGRGTIAAGLRRSGRYVALARKIFAEEGVPQDLVWLAQAESGWNTNAYSAAAAYGIWQFIPGTGARFGLAQNSLIDERGGIEQPTRAAARYLRFLYNQFGDWMLAMAAYNCGEGNVARALARSRYKDFWSLHRQGLLPKETRNYVPIILSMILIAKRPEAYGFQVKPEPPLRYDVLPVTASVDLRSLANQCGVPVEILRGYNPELLTYSTPQNYRLRVPPGAQGTVQTALVAMQATPAAVPGQRIRTRLARTRRQRGM
jgi:membrane-bound lytic murein transglycosylase D